MESIHIKTRENKKDREEINKMRNIIYTDYKNDLDEGNLNIKNERLFIKSKLNQYNNPLIISLITVFVSALVSPYLPEIIDSMEKITDTSNSFWVEFLSIIIFFVIILLITFLLTVLIIKVVYKDYLNYKNRNIYYSICLDVLDELEKEKV